MGSHRLDLKPTRFYFIQTITAGSGQGCVTCPSLTSTVLSWSPNALLLRAPQADMAGTLSTEETFCLAFIAQNSMGMFCLCAAVATVHVQFHGGPSTW